jgi:hypothetical protein
MKNNIILTIVAAVISLSVTSCGKKDIEESVEIPETSITYTGDKATEMREQTIIELLAVKDGVKKTLAQHQEADSMDTFVKDLESLRPRLEYIRMQTSMLPKKEQMIVLGNLAVTTNQLEKELLSMLAKSPGNDDLAVEIANVREKLSPIPLGSVLQKF